MKQKTYTIIHTNCDCSSDIIARASMRWYMGPRCPGCRRVLGPMQWQVFEKEEKVAADSSDDAVMLYKQRRHERLLREREEKIS